MLASKAAMSLKNVAKLVVGLGDGIGNNKGFRENVKNQGSFGADDEWTNKIY